MALKLLKDLKSSERTQPTRDYPGRWLVFGDDKLVGDFPTDEEAYRFATRVCDRHDKVSVAWEANDDDPRIGEVWFTGFYTAYKVCR